MTPYLFIPLITLYLFASDHSLRFRKINSYVIFGLFFYMLLLGFFRFDVGVDYMSYYNHLSFDFNGGRWSPEPGFYYSAKVLLAVGLSPQVVLGLFNVATVCIYALALKNLRHVFGVDRWVYYIYILLPMFWLGSFNQVRQYLAVSIVAYALVFLIKRQTLAFVSLVLLASLFHVTALLFLPLLLFKYGLNILSALLLFVLALIIDAFFEFYDYIPMSSWYLQEGRSVSVILLGVFVSVLMVVLVFLQGRESNREVVRGLNVFGFMLLGGVVLLSLGVFSSDFWANLDRLSVYFALPVPIVLAYFAKTRLGVYERLSFSVLVITLVIAYYVYFVLVGGANIAPYESYLSGIG